jgi:hypothetical protein
MYLAAGFLGMDRQTWLSIAIGSLVSLIISLLIYRMQKSPKTLDYAIRSTFDLNAEASADSWSRMLILWTEGAKGPHQGQRLNQPRIVNYYIRNTGKRAIDGDDFKTPIEVKASEGSIVDTVVTDMSHYGMHKIGRISSEWPDTTAFTPTLMNPKDWIEIQVLTEGCPAPPKLTSWISEESRSMEQRQDLLDPPLWEVLKRQWAHPHYEVLSMLLAVASAVTAIVAFLSSIFK